MIYFNEQNVSPSGVFVCPTHRNRLYVVGGAFMAELSFLQNLGMRSVFRLDPS